VRLATWKDGAPMRVSALAARQAGVAVLDQTVFYAESGGQVGDTGWIVWDGGRARVLDTQKDGAGVVFHFIEVEEGELARHTRVELRVDHEQRLAIQRNHTATHLLHAALRQVLGKSVRQAGSLVAPDRLRFDFTYHRGMFRQEREQVEDLIGEWVRRAVPTEFVWRSYQEAIAAGAMALFGEKYGERVRTVGVPGFSLELCGGCHVHNTGEIGLLLIESERGVASGVRRIEAVTGTQAVAEVRRQRAAYEELTSRLGIHAGDYDQQLQKAEQIRQRQDQLEQEMRRLRMQLVSGAPAGHDGELRVDGVRVMAREVPPAPANELRGGDRHARRGHRVAGGGGQQGSDAADQGRRAGQDAVGDRRRRRRRTRGLRPGGGTRARQAAGRAGGGRGGGARAAGGGPVGCDQITLTG